ncbi:MAG: acyltransferase [Desulfosalsimonadaceae bacterium]|nr:acyltransferase [Desulfosalsimonadaceae bacterium]
MALDRSHAFGGCSVYSKPAYFMWLYKYFLKHMVRLNISERIKSLKVWMQFCNNATISDKVCLGPNAWCINGRKEPENIVLKEGVVCRGLLRTEIFGKGKIIIHSDVYIGDDCLISSANHIEIGAHSLIAHGVQIFDNDTHPVSAKDRDLDWYAIKTGNYELKPEIKGKPIKIGESVWIGFNSIIMKGVSVGNRSVIAAGSVVVTDVPPDVLVAGNPAKIIKDLTGLSEEKK